MRIGILGGTFDPIHYGHILPALEVMSALNLDKIWLMPNHIPPHKNTVKTSSQHRMNMVQLVCDQYTEFKLCDIEITRKTPSYTVTTIQELNEQFPEHQFTFLMGTDSLLSLDKWYQWQKLFELCDIAVMRRPDYPHKKISNLNFLDNHQFTHCIESVKNKKGRLFDIEVKPQNISSTVLRRKIVEQNSIKKMTPTYVQNYIKNNYLYR
ncbi:nicotinate-nucleotide adenylyltransferase [Parashewanella spongiae]|uniref:Probable nicotinate-nucleotide adenylyltransferase n=1 Tax=Parashewanella spongiae TaxID=342950 RepID=A0A3A6ULC4_9GAMM|nr:nicotinate-nucleotide adenylyltransferase [Parashewanella spongiae]MCL1079558.1 nicotinate-nucleotide adenylyltransferase [Parashewanella spongiae]RJY18463.1 nicotinate-nucleotide adenylyltransferase [Parashewanella spongiae]